MKKTTTNVLRVPRKAILPAAIWLGVFVLIPFLMVVVTSFLRKGVYGGLVYEFTTSSFLRIFEPIYLKILFNSVRLATVTTLSCFILGFPIAYVIATSSKKIRYFLLALIVVPLWTNFVVRAYATKFILGEHGPLNQFLLSLGFIEHPIPWTSSSISVWIGMITNYLPFMVLPLYAALERVDFSIVEASRDLGASTVQSLVRVLLPLVKSGVLTGAVFVFAPALGEFVIPDILGGAKTVLIGNVITDQFLKTRNWPFGSALSLLLVLPVILCIYASFRIRSGRSSGSSWFSKGEVR